MKTKKIIIFNLILLLFVFFCLLQKTSLFWHSNSIFGLNINIKSLQLSQSNLNNLTYENQSFKSFNNIIVKANNATYARIKANNTHLYRTASTNENIENKWCLLAETFFVKVLDNFNESFYKVEYNGLFGYVKKEHVNLVNETPTNPFPQQTLFSLKSTTGAYLRATPKQNSSITNTIVTIPQATSGLVYLGKIFGEEGVDTQGKIWYLIKYDNYVGYIHSYFANSYITEPVNNEHTTLKISVEESNLNPLTSYENGFLIFLATIPLVVILVLLYKPNKSKKIDSNLNAPNKVPNKTTVEINDFTEPDI